MLCVLMRIVSHAGAKNTQEGLRISNLAFLLVVPSDIMAVKELSNTGSQWAAGEGLSGQLVCCG